MSSKVDTIYCGPAFSLQTFDIWRDPANITSLILPGFMNMSLCLHHDHDYSFCQIIKNLTLDSMDELLNRGLLAKASES